MATIFDRGDVYAFNVAHRALHDALGDLRILSGDVVGPSDASWQDVAGTCAVNLRTLLDYVEGARERGCVQFPSPNDTDTREPYGPRHQRAREDLRPLPTERGITMRDISPRAYYWIDGSEVVVQNVIGPYMGQEHRHTPKDFERWKRDAIASGFEVLAIKTKEKTS